MKKRYIRTLCFTFLATVFRNYKGNQT